MSETFQKSWSGGEICPAEYGRVDLVKYATGARTMRNLFVARHGGAYNRPGTKFVSTAGNSNYRIRLVPFEVPGNVHYQLEFGNLYVRVLQNGKPFNISNKTIASVALGSTTTIVFNEYHSMSIGEKFTISGIASGSTTQLNGQTATITGTPSTGYSVQVSINSTNYTPYVFGSGGVITPTVIRPVQFTTPYTEAMLRQFTFVQSDYSLIIAHQSALPFVMTYRAPESWGIVQDQTIGTPSIGAVVNLLCTPSYSSGAFMYIGITALKQDTFEESPITTLKVPWAPPTNSAPLTIGWSGMANAIQYNYYRGTDPNAMGFVLSTAGTNLIDYGGAPTTDYTTTPPIEQQRFAGGVSNGVGGMIPGAVGYYQQRRYFGNFGPINTALGPPAVLPQLQNYADRIYGSRIGSPTYFYSTRPSTDDGFLSFRLLSKSPQEIRHFLDVGKLLVFTAQGEWLIAGDPGSGGITPSLINPTLLGQDGSGYTRPLAVGQVALFVNYDVNLKTCHVKSIGYTFQTEGYQGNDLTINSAHLFENHGIVAWDFQKLPDPIAWCAREDGLLLGMTWVPEQALVAWHRHDFVNGLVEDVLYSGGQIYLVINRTVSGQTVRSIEVFASRTYSDIRDAIFVDSCVTYDGRSTAAQYTNNGTTAPYTMTLSGGTTWDYTELLTLTSSQNIFQVSSIGQFIHLTGADGSLTRFKMVGINSGTVCQGYADKPVPLSLRSIGTQTWSYAITTMTGCSNLEGQAVSILGDGFVVSSVNNSSYPTLTVTGGSVALSDGSIGYGVVQVGLPITSDLETLNIDNPGGPTLIDKRKQITKLSMYLDSSRSIFVGGVKPDDDSEDLTDGLYTGLSESKYSYDQGYDTPKNLVTRVVEVNLEAQWNSHGRVFIRQVDPLPVGILAIAPSGYIGS